MAAAGMRSARFVSGMPVRLAIAAREVGLHIVAPFVAIVGVQVAARVSGVAWLDVAMHVGILAAPLVLTWRRSRWALWGWFFAAIEAYGLIWAAAPTWGVPVRFEYAAVLDRIVGLGEVPTVRLQALYHGTPGPFDRVMSSVYASFFVLPYVTFFALWRKRRGLVGRYATAFGATLFLGLAVIVVVPTAPPWMASQSGLVGPVQRVMLAIAGQGNHARANELVGENTVAAMPSVHAAAALVIALAAGRLHPGLRRVAWLYPVAMGFALVYLGEHYVVDVAAGYAVALAGWRLAAAFESSSRARRLLGLDATPTAADRLPGTMPEASAPTR